MARYKNVVYDLRGYITKVCTCICCMRYICA